MDATFTPAEAQGINQVGEVEASLESLGLPYAEDEKSEMINSEQDDVSIRASISYYVAEDWENYSEKTNANLCRDCQCTFGQWGKHAASRVPESPPGRYDLYRYDSNIWSLEKGDSDGCPFCSLIVQAISQKIPGGYDSENIVGISFERRREGWEVFFNTGEYDEWRLALEILPSTKIDPGEWRHDKTHIAGYANC